MLFVCTANVCRSPLAEGMLRQRLRELGLGRRVRVSSAGTQVGQRGRRPDARMERIAAEAGISLQGIRSRPLNSAMIRRCDYVLVMEQSHLEQAGSLVSVPAELGKLQLLGSYLPLEGGRVQDIPDPYYGNWQGFAEVFKCIDKALNHLVPELARRLDVDV